MPEMLPLEVAGSKLLERTNASESKSNDDGSTTPCGRAGQ
jgi:hypothetical protein